jgi:hypothetical protein
MGTPLSNLHANLLIRSGVVVDNFGDSTGVLDL